MCHTEVSGVKKVRQFYFLFSVCDLWLSTLFLPDVDNNGFISKDELNELFKAANLALPGYRIRELVQEFTKNSDQLTFDEFTHVSSQIEAHAVKCTVWTST